MFKLSINNSIIIFDIVKKINALLKKDYINFFNKPYKVLINI